MDIVGPLPTTDHGYRYILTIQDLLTKYLITTEAGNGADIAEEENLALVENFINPYTAP
jgi:hypothetical protein